MFSASDPPRPLVELDRLARRWRDGELNAAMFAALYFLLCQMARHGRHFAARKHKSDTRPDAGAWLEIIVALPLTSLQGRIVDWLDGYQFRGVIGNVSVALLHWLRAGWPLVLRADVPLPLELLRMQARGTRVVTAITDWPRWHEPVLNKPDAFAFFLHDLEHAYKFFHAPELYASQCAFFSRLETAFDRGVFTLYLENHEFAGKFNYLMSDMNTHPEHSLQYLRAILIEFYLRRERKALTEPLGSDDEREILDVLRTVAVVAPWPNGVETQRTRPLSVRDFIQPPHRQIA